MAASEPIFRIAQLSDLHCGGPYFEASLLERAIGEINELQPDIVVCSGDLTTFGFRHGYLTAREYVDRIDCDSIVVVPGNHDSRNVGYVHFEELFGERNSVLRKGGVTIVAIDSSEPDLDHGQIGRGRYRWIEQQFADDDAAELRIFVLHHHLLPVPGTGRERNVVYDAGDCIECLQRAGVDLVLSGHKHVPYAWRLENLFVVNAGTVSSRRLRGKTRPCYNVIEIAENHVDVWRKYPFHGEERIIQFSTETLAFARGERDRQARRQGGRHGAPGPAARARPRPRSRGDGPRRPSRPRARAGAADPRAAARALACGASRRIGLPGDRGARGRGDDRLPSRRRWSRRCTGRVERPRRRCARRRAGARSRALRRQRRRDPAHRRRRARARDELGPTRRGRDGLLERLPHPDLRPGRGDRRRERAAA